MNLDFNAITAGATVFAVFVALYALWIEQRRSRFSQGVELLLRMNDLFFYSKDFIQNRRGAARFLKKKFSPKAGSKSAEGGFKPEDFSSVELDAILDFFSGMAMLVYRGAIDKKLLWGNFYWWLNCYYTLSQDYIEYWRSKDPNTWEDVIWLYKQTTKIEKKENPKGRTLPSNEDLLIFLEDEIKLKSTKT